VGVLLEAVDRVLENGEHETPLAIEARFLPEEGEELPWKQYIRFEETSWTVLD